MKLYRKLPKLIRMIISIMLLLLLLMTAYRLVFFFYYQPQNRPFSGSMMLMGLRYDLRIVSALALIVLIASIFPRLRPFRDSRINKGWIIFFSSVLLLFLIFYGTDFYYYDYLKQRLNASVITFLQDAAISFGMVWQTYPVVRMVLLIIVILLLFSWWLKRYFRREQAESSAPLSKRSRIIIYTGFVLLLGVFVFGRLGQYPLRWSDAFSIGDDYKANTSLNPFQSFFSSLKYKNSGFDIQKVKEHYALMSSYMEVDKPDSIRLNFDRTISFREAPKPYNVVLVICESFSAYKSSMFGNKLDPTPFFNELSQQGAFFERCFTPAFGTARGVWATITGIPDVASPNTASRNPSVVDQHTIINDFKQHDKFYFLGGSTTWANIRGLLTNNISGLKIYEQDDFKAKQVDVWGISDKNLFLEANRILAGQSRPFFSIIQTADNHRPYTIPSEDLVEFKKLQVNEDTLKKYGFDDNAQYNAFRYTDFCFKKFMDAARKENYYNNTIFVFVGDHGLRGDAGEMFPASFTKQGILAEHVPLLFYAPGIIQPLRVSEPASQLDILPSLAALCNNPYTNTTLGRDLFDTTGGRNHFSFIADPDLQTIGLVGTNYYFSRHLKTGKTEFVSVKDNRNPANDPGADSIRTLMQELTEAWYETSRYMLFNNRKKN